MYEDFITLIKEFPSDYELYCYLKNHINFGSNTLNINLSCLICSELNHDTMSCPYY